MEKGRDEVGHTHCWHAYVGALMMAVPAGHVVQACCECHALRTVHRGHAR